MALYIRDPEVGELAGEAVKILGAANKTEAVRMALKAAIDTAKSRKPLLERLEAARKMAETIGPAAPDYDHERALDGGRNE